MPPLPSQESLIKEGESEPIELVEAFAKILSLDLDSLKSIDLNRVFIFLVQINHFSSIIALRMRQRDTPQNNLY
jgi:hypothetical protein